MDSMEGKKSALLKLLSELKGWDGERLRAKKGLPAEEPAQEPLEAGPEEEQESALVELLKRLVK